VATDFSSALEVLESQYNAQLKKKIESELREIGRLEATREIQLKAILTIVSILKEFVSDVSRWKSLMIELEV
jgi:hypothetical protein